MSLLLRIWLAAIAPLVWLIAHLRPKPKTPPPPPPVPGVTI